MKDFVGQELNVGDNVAYVGRGNRRLGQGVITKIMTKQVRIMPHGSIEHPGFVRDADRVVKYFKGKLGLY